jgi:hypothetical protein
MSACGVFRGQPEPILVTRANYQPFTANYRGVSFGRTTQYFDEQPTHTDFGFEYFVTTDVTAAAEGLAATLVLDSVNLYDGATGGVSQEHVDSAWGTAFTATMGSDGRLADFSGGEYAGPLAREIADRLLRPFFPIVPGLGAEPGAEWSDTTENRMAVNGLDNAIQMVSQHSASDWTQHAGERALHIVTVSSYTFSGTGDQAGSSFTLDGTGKRHTHRYLSDTGRYLGMVSADTSEGEARITDMEIVIPIHQTRIDSLLIR